MEGDELASPSIQLIKIHIVFKNQVINVPPIRKCFKTQAGPDRALKASNRSLDLEIGRFCFGILAHRSLLDRSGCLLLQTGYRMHEEGRSAPEQTQIIPSGKPMDVQYIWRNLKEILKDLENP